MWECFFIHTFFLLSYRIDVIILNEEFHASLLVLRKKLCWDYLDIFFTKKNVQKRNSSAPFTEADAVKVLDMRHNYGDKLLYDALNTTWWYQTEVKVQDFWDEVCRNIRVDTVTISTDFNSPPSGGQNYYEICQVLMVLYVI